MWEGGWQCLVGFHLIYEPAWLATLITKVLFLGSDQFNFAVSRFLSFWGKLVAALFGVSKFKAESKFLLYPSINGILILVRAYGKCVSMRLIFLHIFISSL